MQNRPNTSKIRLKRDLEYPRESRPQRPQSAIAESSYVFNKPTNGEFGSGQVYLSARRCTTRLQRRPVTHFQRGTHKYRLTLSRVRDHENLDDDNQDCLSQFVPTIYVDNNINQEASTSPTFFRNSLSQDSFDQNIYDKFALNNSTKMPPINPNSEEKETNNLNSDEKNEADNVEEDFQQHPSKLFHRRYIFSGESQKPNRKAFHDEKNFNRRFYCDNNSMENNNWETTDESDKEGSKPNSKRVINCINFFYTMQELNNSQNEPSKKSLVKQVVKVFPRSKTALSMKEKKINSNTSSEFQVEALQSPITQNTVLDSNEVSSQTNNFSDAPEVYMESFQYENQNCSSDDEFELIKIKSKKFKQKCSEIGKDRNNSIKTKSLDEKINKNSNLEEEKQEEEQSEVSYLANQSIETSENNSSEVFSYVDTTPESSIRRNSKSCSKKNKVKFDLDLEVHVVPRETAKSSSKTKDKHLTDDKSSDFNNLSFKNKLAEEEKELTRSDESFSTEPTAKPNVSPFKLIIRDRSLNQKRLKKSYKSRIIPSGHKKLLLNSSDRAQLSPKQQETFIFSTSEAESSTPESSLSKSSSLKSSNDNKTKSYHENISVKKTIKHKAENKIHSWQTSIALDQKENSSSYTFRAPEKIPSLSNSSSPSQLTSSFQLQNKSLKSGNHRMFPKLSSTKCHTKSLDLTEGNKTDDESSILSCSDKVSSTGTVTITCVNKNGWWKQKITMDKKNPKSLQLSPNTTTLEDTAVPKNLNRNCYKKKKLKPSHVPILINEKPQDLKQYSSFSTSICSSDQSTSSFPSFTVTNVYHQRLRRRRTELLTPKSDYSTTTKDEASTDLAAK